MIRMLLIILLGVVVAGCASMGFRTEGTSGPVTWRAEHFRIIQWVSSQDSEGKARDRYEWILVLKETQGRAITFTHRQYTAYQRGVTAAFTRKKTGHWELRPDGELRFPFNYFIFCPQGPCTDWGAVFPTYNFIFTGTDDQNHPVYMAIDLTLPPNPSPSVARVLGFLTERAYGKVRLSEMNFRHTFDVAEDDEVVVYLSLYNDALHDPVGVTVRLYDPQGQYTQEWAHTYTIHSPDAKGTYKVHSLALTQMAPKLGTWKVQAFVEEQVIASETFTLTSSSK